MITILCSMIGVVLGVLVLILILYIFIRTMLNKAGFGSYSLLQLYNEMMEARRETKIKHKQVSGITNVLLPTIMDDFPDFNLQQFYSKAEEHIRGILTSIEEKNIELLNNDDYDLIREKINLQIADLIDNNIVYKYDDIIFHKHAIKSYQKKKGMVKLDISTSLEYYYEKIESDGKIKKDKEGMKKQTRYTTSYVYIYDTKKAGFNINVLGLNCPNCGSAVSDLNTGTCSYCHSGLNITVANLLKCWKIIEIKEDY